MFSELLSNNEDRLQALIGQFKNVSKEIKESNKVMFRLYYKILSYQLNILELNLIVLNYKNYDFPEKILFICYKNLITIVSALKLIQEGYIGSAKIMFRNIYESLIIAKYLGTTENKQFYDKWLKGEQISLKKEIFRKLATKPSPEATELWDFLNKYNHSTIISQNFRFQYNQNDINECNTILGTLLEMNYKLFNAHVSKYYNYYLKLYFSPYYDQIKQDLKKLLECSRKMLDPRCQKVIKEYSTKWTFNEK